MTPAIPEAEILPKFANFLSGKIPLPILHIRDFPEVEY